VQSSVFGHLGVQNHRTIFKQLGLYLKPISWNLKEPVSSLMGRRNLLMFCTYLLENAGSWQGHYQDEHQENGHLALIQMLNRELLKLDAELFRY